MKRTLITTADERTWPTAGAVLFLGEWCRRLQRRAHWEKFDAEVLPYHWDDRDKLYRDYDALRAVYESLLPKVARALNAQHGVTRSNRYWRILVGPWLYPFINTVFDRWTMLEHATGKYEIDNTLIIDEPAARMIPAEFRGFHPQDTRWNHDICGRIIRHQGRIPCTLLPPEAAPPAIGGSAATQAVGTLRRLKNRLLALPGLLTRPQEAMVIGSGLTRSAEIQLQLSLGQIPKFWRSPAVQPAAPDLALRRRLALDGDSEDAFRRFIGGEIFMQMPAAYLEGYAPLAAQAAALPWPQKPRFVFTAINYNFDEVFKAWAADKVEAGAPLIIGQHGGHMGSAKRSAGEDHQIEIADRFLTWGWRDERPSTFPALALTNVGKPPARIDWAGGALLVTSPLGLFSYKLSAAPIGANQSIAFLNDQLAFAAALSEPLRAALTVRIDESVEKRLGTPYIAQWQARFPGIRLDFSRGAIDSALAQSRLVINTYNSTGFLETLARNIPTLIFWNPAYFELRPAAKPYFERLNAVGIFHETPAGAAAKLIEVWNNVDGWWASPELQQVRREFCEEFARMPAHPILEIRNALSGAASSQHARVSESNCQA